MKQHNYNGWDNSLCNPVYAKKINEFAEDSQIVTVAYAAVDHMNDVFNAAHELKEYIVEQDENEEKSGNCAMIGSIYEKCMNTVINNHAKHVYKKVGKKTTDFVCEIPVHNFELKTSYGRNGIYMHKGKTIFDRAAYYKFPLSNQLANENSTKERRGTFFVHVKIKHPKTMDDNFEIVCIFICYINPDDVRCCNRTGYLLADVLKSQSLMLYENTDNLKECIDYVDYIASLNQ